MSFYANETRIRIRHAVAAVIALASTLVAPMASAAYVGTLAFTEPTGTVGPTDSIPVRIRFTLSPMSDSLDLANDPGAAPPFGLLPANYPTFFSEELNVAGTLYYQLASIDSLSDVGLNTSFLCTGTFTNVCGPGAYAFTFNTSGPESINYRPMQNGSPFTLQPGESFDYLFGTFDPTSGGPVAPGDYYFYRSNLFLDIRGTAQWRIQATDPQGQPIFDQNDDPVWLPDLQTASLNGEIELASTPCDFSTSDPSCAGAFTRTVVPAPGAIWLMGTGFGFVAWRARRRLAN